MLVAVLNQQLEAARLLLAAGADPNVTDDEGDSPLRLSVEKKDHRMAALLLLCGADKAIHDSGGMSGMSALGRAAWNLDIPMIELLLAAGADPDSPDVDRQTASERLPPRKESDPQIWDAAAVLLGRGSSSNAEGSL
ncbi:hypothetical protein FRUB_04815 [Fimbriiglobus ruber]|uniref:Uncharacterized protein n=1 Tax=Fimbriiglobus ruber TaxID=1908690 RepID=A0A225DIX2_9BACT|nr:hypothetical protein FRUB_04815 [Fimbriiglobus ruber]